jgi:hypothetical protein
MPLFVWKTVNFEAETFFLTRLPLKLPSGRSNISQQKKVLEIIETKDTNSLFCVRILTSFFFSNQCVFSFFFQ